MTFRTSAAAALLLACGASIPAMAAAQDLSWGVTFTSNYMSDSVTQSDDRPALQGYVEYGLNGFYAGVWASTVDFGPGSDNVEVDLYLGFRNEIGAVSYDVGYARYLYDRTGNCCGEFLASVDADMGQGLSLGVSFAYNNRDDELTSRMGASYSPDDLFKVSGTFGRSQANANHFWDLGVGYALQPNIGLDLRYHDTTNTRGRAVVSVGVDF